MHGSSSLAEFGATRRVDRADASRTRSLSQHLQLRRIRRIVADAAGSPQKNHGGSELSRPGSWRRDRRRSPCGAVRILFLTIARSISQPEMDPLRRRAGPARYSPAHRKSAPRSDFPRLLDEIASPRASSFVPGCGERRASARLSRDHVGAPGFASILPTLATNPVTASRRARPRQSIPRLRQEHRDEDAWALYRHDCCGREK
jgi:hypothetical protein